MAIDVGSNCTLRGSLGVINGETVIAEANPANADGSIDYICIYTAAISYAVQVASFINEGGNVFSTRAWVSLGQISSGKQEFNAPGDFTAFSIQTGDYLGLRTGYGVVRYSVSAGVGLWRETGDYVPCSSQAFTTFNTNVEYSIYATGIEGGAGGIVPIILGLMNKMRG